VQVWVVIAVSAAYIATLFGVAWYGDRQAAQGRPPLPFLWRSGIFFALTLTVYNTTWSYYGSVGRASTGGFDFLPIYIGPTVALLLGHRMLRKAITVVKAQNITSIADFLAGRYGKSQGLAALVTLTALISLLPYIALQLKALGSSFDGLTGQAGSRSDPIWSDTAFAVTVAMAAFSILFGVRHIHAKEHHRGLMLAIVFEGIVKLAAFIAVGVFIMLGLPEGPVELFQIAARQPELARLLDPDFFAPTWFSNSLIAFFAFFCMPHKFHVLMVENEDSRHLRPAALIFPAYLLIFSLFIVPIALSGLMLVGQGTLNPDTFVLALPLRLGSPEIALLAFIGGLSAGTGMVIMSVVALSTMVCNDVVMPLLLRRASFRQGRDLTRVLLFIRRAAIILILLLAFLTYRLIGENYALTTIGLMSFVAVAQFGPSFLGALYWRRATRAGAVAGIVGGLLVWAYTLLLPAIVLLRYADLSFLQTGPWGVEFLSAHALFGLGELDAISHATFWSLTVNSVLYILVSRLTRPSVMEQAQAKAYVEAAPHPEPLRPRIWSILTRLTDLRAIATRYLGEEAGGEAFDRFIAARYPQAEPFYREGVADLEAVRFTEHLLAGAIGSASARVVMAASVKRRSLSRGDARLMLDQASQVIGSQADLLRGTIDSVRQGICVLDADLTVLVWNKRFVDLLDFPPSLVRVGMPMAELVRFNTARREYAAGDIDALLVNRFDDITDWPYRHERRRPDGTVIELLTDLMPGGGYVTTYTDITERHLAAARLQEINESLEVRVRERTEALQAAKAEAERANSSKTSFLAAASHDLMQPLNAARLFTTALGERLADGNTASAQDMVQNIGASLQSVEHLLSALLDISALEAGAMRAQKRDFALGPLLALLAVEVEALAADRPAHRRLRVRAVPTLARVQTDPDLLRRILQNFLTNAVRYTPRGTVLMGCRNRGDAVRIEVWDTGIGIPEERQQEIFQEFRRLAPNADEGPTGLGLGLAIVERIARGLDHAIEVRSVLGRGSCFAVTVPRAVMLSPLPVLPPAVLPPTRPGLSVLCVDNDTAILAGMRALLEGWGCAVRTAATPSAAEALLGDYRPALVVADYHLEAEVDGLTLLETLSPGSAPPIARVLLTADRSPALRARAVAANIQLLYKPLRPAALRSYLNALSVQAEVDTR
jgi:Na+/proline symporter/signal transduction histidine kinase/ActR/RegA family two-component response regulator